MIFKTQNNPTQQELLVLIDAAKNAELCRNLNLSKKVLDTVLEDFEPAAFLEEIEPLLRAEILRLCGFFISFYGHSKQERHFQERGRNILTNAIDVFESLGCSDKVAEARVMLALCYYYEGALNESDLILEQTAEEFRDNQLHPVYLQIRINQMMSMYFRQNIQDALEILEEIRIPMEFCTDLRLQAMYHNQAGVVYCVSKPDKALHHHNEAIRFAKRVNNLFFVAANLNNIAVFYIEIKQFDKAYKAINEAIELYEEIKAFGSLPHAYDTYAHILVAHNRFAEALEKIETAVEMFSQGEDYLGQVEALWTKTEILLRLGDRKIDALMSFTVLLQVAEMRMGEFAAKRYAEKFANMIYVTQFLTYPNEVKAFKRETLVKHLKAAHLDLSDAADSMGISHQALSELLNNQFPHLREELGIKQRARRSDSKLSSLLKPRAEKGKIVKELRGDKIIPFDIPEPVQVRGAAIGGDEMLTFFVPADKFSQIATLNDEAADTDVIVAISKSSYVAGERFLILRKLENEFDCGFAEMDTLTSLLYFVNNLGEPQPFTANDIFSVGKIISYCPVNEVQAGIKSGKTVCFKQFK